MKLFDKVREIFTEPMDEDIEDETVEIEPVKVEKVKTEPKSTRESIKERFKSINAHEIEEEVEETVTESKEVVEVEKEPTRELEPVKEIHKRESINTPVFFTAEDFADLEPEKPKKVEPKRETESRINRRDEHKPYSGNYTGSYTSTSILTKEKPTFKPSLIISPVYGVLGSNYSKEDIVEKKVESGSRTVEDKSTDGMAHDRFDEVRNKAYGTLEDELEETIYDKKEPRHEAMKDDADLFEELENDNNEIRLEDTQELAKTVTEQEKNIRELEEITMDLTKELDNLLLKKESFNSKKEKVARKQKEAEEDDAPLSKNELFDLIDSMYEEGKE